MPFKKNTAINGFTFGLINASDGSDITSGVVTGYYTLDGGSQSTLVDSPSHKGNGQWSVDLTASEMNGDVVGLAFIEASAITTHFTIKTETKLVSELNDFDPNTDAVANVTNTGSLTTNNDKTGYSILGSKNTLDDLNDIKASDVISDGVAINATFGVIDTVNTVNITSVNTDMRGTDNALLSSSYTAPDNTTISAIDGKVDTIGVVTTDTNTKVTSIQGDYSTLTAAQVWSNATRELTSGNNIVLDKGVGVTGFNDVSVVDIWDTALTESYAPNGSAMTGAQAVHMIWSDLRSPDQSGTTWSDYQLDNVSVSMTFTLDDAVTPSRKTRVT